MSSLKPMLSVRGIYSGLFYALTPLLLARLMWRSRAAPAYRLRWDERFGLYTNAVQSGVIWIHAVSVGEAEAAFPLIRALMKRYPDRPFLVTTTTPTGSTRVCEVLGTAVQHVYLPYDLPDCVARFLDKFRPSLGVVMETEIWPNLFDACARQGIPLAIVNARLSEKSARGYARLGGLTRSSLAALSWVGAQSEADAERFLRLGAKRETLSVTGNIKFDQETPEDLVSRAAGLRTELFGERPVLVVGSTHAGEERELVETLARIKECRPDLLMVLVPRHPERFDEVAAYCLKQGYKLVRRSEGRSARDVDVFLLDAMGELRLFYAAADMAFVGGSLVPTGGHNVLEPAASGIPVMVGPHTHNFKEVTGKLVESGGAVRVSNAAELAACALEWLGSPDLARDVGSRGRQFVEAGRGALSQTVRSLSKFLDAPSQAT